MTTAVYSLDCPADDLIVWCRILKDIGELISELGFLAARGEDILSPDVAKSLGDVVGHYSRGIENLVNRSYGAINEHFESEQKWDEAAKMPNHEAISDINKKMEIMSRRLGNLEWLKMQKESAPAGGKDQAGAGKQPDQK